MKNVAIVAEYNPFHTGHAYQIRRIREEFGADATVIALMSGTFVQRGDIAVADKWVRAEAAVRGGVDLVLELPFPYSMAGAEFYATAAVRLLRAIGGWTSFLSAPNRAISRFFCALPKICKATLFAHLSEPRSKKTAKAVMPRRRKTYIARFSPRRCATDFSVPTTFSLSNT